MSATMTQMVARGLPSLSHARSTSPASTSAAPARARHGGVAPRVPGEVKRSARKAGLARGVAGIGQPAGMNTDAIDDRSQPWLAWTSSDELEVRAPRSKLMYLLAENSRAAYELQKFEEITGRMAMLTFAGAVTLELTEGHGLFAGMDAGIISGFGFVAVSAILSGIQAAEMVYERGLESGNPTSAGFTRWLADSCQSIARDRAPRASTHTEYDLQVDLSIQRVYASVACEPPSRL